MFEKFINEMKKIRKKQGNNFRWINEENYFSFLDCSNEP